MTKITELYKNESLIGFKLEGHANYSIPGRDIVCAAISVITINTINSIEELGHTYPTVYESDGYTEYYIENRINIATNILLQAAKNGYRSISEQYPNNVAMVVSK